MAKKRYPIILSAICIGAFLSGIWAGYAKTKSEESVKLPTENAREVIVEEETLPFIPEKELVLYKIKGSEGEIMVYEVFSDKTEKEIEKFSINTDIIPYNEKKKLEEGIEFTEKEEMLMVLESITS